MSDRPPILVDADWPGLSARPRRMGILHRVLVRGEEVLSFEYARDWLELGEPFVLDPKLHYFGGRQYADSPDGFGLFSDSAPDRWGRLLIQRRASLEGKGASGLHETDYLLAVSDRCRMGGVRFRLSEDSPYLAEANDYFASAMNLLGYQDGDGAKTGASYLDLVDWIERNGADVEADLEELWRRIVFNICVHNTDDHLRNHGFLLGAKGWHLSPVYDVNPQPWPGGLALNVDDASNACDLDLARSVGRYFRLSNKRQDQILSEVRSSLGQWRERALGLGISRSEVEQMKIAFEAVKD